MLKHGCAFETMMSVKVCIIDHCCSHVKDCVMCPLQEMKRGRTEQIQNVVTQYLKRRQYIDTDGCLKGAKLSQSAEEMAASLTGNLFANIPSFVHVSKITAMSVSLTCAVQTETSCANVVSAAPCQSDPHQYESQFSRLRSFLQGKYLHVLVLFLQLRGLTTLLCFSDAQAPWTKEVSGVLFPLFLYLHLDMARCGLKGSVDSFYGRFHSFFQQDPEQKAIVDLLKGVVSLQVSYCLEKNYK